MDDIYYNRYTKSRKKEIALEMQVDEQFKEYMHAI